MNWIILAIFSYLLISIQTVLDKFLISSKRVSHPVVYSFYSGALSFFTIFLFAPFGFHLIAARELALSIISGLIFAYGVLSLFFAINRSQASQVVPVVGAVIPIATYIFSLIFGWESLNFWQIAGVLFLIFGGLLISFDFPLKKIDGKKFFSGFYFSILSGMLLGGGFAIFKELYENDSFSNVFIWTRLGLFSGALTYLLISDWRTRILRSFKAVSKNRKENVRTVVLFIFNKILGGTGSAMANYAIFLGSVTIVNALVSVEYIFIFILGLVLSRWYPKIFHERWGFWNIVQKISAIIIITIGIILIK